MAEWQPIASAPRDGTEIWIYKRVGFVCPMSVAHFSEGRWHLRGGGSYAEDEPEGWGPMSLKCDGED